MIIIERSALVNYSAEQMYTLVDDIEQYPKFMQGCIAAEVLSRTDSEVTGRLTLGKAGLKYSFTTRNRLVPNEVMEMSLIEGPFRSFNATWRFLELTPEACKISLHMSFDWSGGLLSSAMKKLFQYSANSLVDELVSRAQELYGKNS
jgi:ribosome-associated toxin RatA of RatAB toxin-antitoxin module